MRIVLLTITLFAGGFLGTGALAQQIADKTIDTTVANPMFEVNRGPVVAVDSGHHNYHTITERFGPFAALLRSDGFQILNSAEPFSPNRLAAVRVLVISNALPASTVTDWQKPASSAFSSQEIDALKAWIHSGGSLLLIADHLPFAGAAADLAYAFGFQFKDGLARREPPDGTPDIFTLKEGTLKDDVVTHGRGVEEKIDAIQTFGGSVFRAPQSARPLIVIPQDYAILNCGLPCPDHVPATSAEGYLQGAVLRYGKGRVAVFGEAAMFTAQLAGPDRFPIGFNSPTAPHNKQFVLNVVRWLAGALPAS